LKTGNKKQATILAIVAVGALAFLIVQFLPAKGRGSLIALVTGRTEEPSNAIDSSGLPLVLVRDAFSHPKLALAREDAKPAQDSAAPSQGQLRGTLGVDGFSPATVDSLPGTIEGSESGIADDSDMDPPPTGRLPEENTRPSQQVNKAAMRKLVLRAVVLAGHSVAFISIDGEPERTFREGEAVVPGIRVMAINRDGVKLKIGGKLRFVAVGQEVGP
jgi:hypothetical protein